MHVKPRPPYGSVSQKPPAAPTPGAPPTLEDLVARMRQGDRDAVGEFVTLYGPFVRRRVRGKLGPAMRRLFDSQEILSTLSRRLDRYVRSGRVEAATEPQLWALVFRMVDAAMVDKIRIIRRLRHVEGDDTEFARTLLNRLQSTEQAGHEEVELTVDAALGALQNATDRQILSLWLMGSSHRVIAEYVGLSHDATRKRWQSIRERLRSGFAEGTV
jgi:DNA-directed RNA polymerase specialized sigma24 family protein